MYKISLKSSRGQWVKWSFPSPVIPPLDCWLSGHLRGERSMPGLTVSAHTWGDCSGERFVVYQHGETESNVWNTFVWSCPTWPSRWGMRISIDWPRLKSCQAVCDECMKGEIYSSRSLSRDAGCSAMWPLRESRVTKILGLEYDHGFVLFLFATTGFHIARSGIFWTPTFVL